MKTLVPKRTTWLMLLSVVAGCCVSWYVTRMQCRSELRQTYEQLLVNDINQERLKIAVARQIFVGRGLEWAEVQLENVSLRAIAIPPGGEAWTSLLCEIRATAAATNREVPYLAEAIQSDEVRAACESYDPGWFMGPGRWH